MKKTKLNDYHVKQKAYFIDFFGWNLPARYTGILDEHMAVRQRAGLFDVSHMGEIIINGNQALDLVQYLTPNNAAKLSPGKAQYSALTTPLGTFVDDLLVYCLSEKEYLLVVNASNVDKDYDWIKSHSQNYDVSVNNVSDQYTQLALQGRDAQKILQKLTDIDLSEMKSFRYKIGKIAGIDSLISRTGYTGEDGFEIYTTHDNPGIIWESILEKGSSFGCLPIGLGARDTLRLESCLMLYGNDIDETTTVYEAGLRWLVKLKKGEFLGRDILLKQKEEGITRRISGFEVTGNGIARSHYPVFINGEKISEVTSGTFSPYLKKSIGLTYLPMEFIEPGTLLGIEIRGKEVEAKVVSIPFYKRKES